MELLNGKIVAEGILARLQERIQADGLKPCLGVVLVGNDRASHVYVSLKEKAAARVGIAVEKVLLPEESSQRQVEQVIQRMNQDANIHGILVQLPLPGHVDMQKVIDVIDPAKDVDGFHPESEKLFLSGKEKFLPVFPRAIFELILASSQELSGKRAVVIGNSDTFGQMMLSMLSRAGVAGEFIRQNFLSCRAASVLAADIVISACGTPGLLRGDMFKPGSIVIDGGIVQVGDKVVGDVDKESAQDKDIFLSPVPGGVGPLTIACILENTFLAVQTKTAQ